MASGDKKLEETILKAFSIAYQSSHADVAEHLLRAIECLNESHCGCRNTAYSIIFEDIERSQVPHRGLAPSHRNTGVQNVKAVRRTMRRRSLIRSAS